MDQNQLAKACGLKLRSLVRRMAFSTVRFHSVNLPGPVVSFEEVLSCHTLPMVPTVH